MKSQASGRQGLDLFLVGFLVLFLELACIRWFAASVIFLQFFTNIILLAAFLGMSCGSLAARARRDWLGLFPYLTLGTVVAALVMAAVYDNWQGLAVDVGNQTSPQEVFFGAEYRNPDVARFVVPIEAVMAAFFLAVSLCFVGLGQVLGRAFDATPDRVRGYALNIGGSLAGIVVFSLFSALDLPACLWFLIASLGVGYLLHQAGALDRGRSTALTLLPIAIALPSFLVGDGHSVRWSPYYAVDFERPTGNITVNGIGHQQMVPFDKGGGVYSLIHLLRRHSGQKPFGQALIIGAGSGNDVAHALRFGVGAIDAVEIDPLIQAIGREHPDHPYADARVNAVNDDGRHFLRITGKRYDLVVYALVDSLILHSGYANVRLESYLFTEEAFADVRRVLAPGGTFVMYNYFRQGWIVERVAAMAEKAFGCAPVVVSLPYAETILPAAATGFTAIIVACDGSTAAAFREHPQFWLNRDPPKNLSVDGFTLAPGAQAEADGWQKIAPARLQREQAAVTATDDWPYLYLRGRLIPDLNLRAAAILGVLGIGMVAWFLPRGQIRLDPRMFFLGAGFMLLETKAVVEMALLFGNTWAVNSLVFFTVLVLILIANLVVLKWPGIRFGPNYIGLILFLAAGVLAPLDLFLGGGVLWRYAAPALLALGPLYFAGVIFARHFRDHAHPDQAFGSNIAGSVVGGLSEACSMVLGFRYLLLVAVAFYLLSLWRGRPA